MPYIHPFEMYIVLICHIYFSFTLVETLVYLSTHTYMLLSIILFVFAHLIAIGSTMLFHVILCIMDITNTTNFIHWYLSMTYYTHIRFYIDVKPVCTFIVSYYVFTCQIPWNMMISSYVLTHYIPISVFIDYVLMVTPCELVLWADLLTKSSCFEWG